MRISGVLTISVLCTLLSACRPPAHSNSTSDSASPVVMTTFYPTTFLAERIAGGLIDVQCPLPEGADPATWEPDPEAMRAYQSAGLIVVNGASFEQWVAKAPLPRSRVVDTTAKKSDELLRYENAITHSHGMGGTHSHEGVDGHTWLDPLMAVAQAEAIGESMSETFTEHADAFRRNLRALAADLHTLDRELTDLGATMEGVSVICSHPAYSYLGRRYNWNLVIVPLDPDSEISQEGLQTLRRAVESAGPKRVVLWESPASDENAAAIRDAIGAESVLYSPCERAPGEGDFLSVMRDNISRLRAALSAGG